MKRMSIALTLIMAVGVAGAKVKLPAVISDNMVVQQQEDITLWGWADAGKKVTVSNSWNGQTVAVSADSKGKFEVKMHTPAASYKTYSLWFDDGDITEVKDVLVGEVWLASGQSNMNMPVSGILLAPTGAPNQVVEEAMAFKGKIREFDVAHKESFELLDDVTGAWNEPGLETTYNFSAVAIHFAMSLQRALDVPVGILHSSCGGTQVECWVDHETVSHYPDIKVDTAEELFAMKAQSRHTGLYNAMIHPLLKYVVKGFIWYQGESNAIWDTKGEACEAASISTYAQRLSDMVNLWRNKFNLPNAPFYAVELAPHTYGKSDTQGPLLREQQWQAINMIPNSDMICTSDLIEERERGNIHPLNKRGVGQRLCALALNETYGFKKVICHGPRYKSMTVEDGAVIIEMQEPQWLYVADGGRGFQVAGADKVFHPATAKLHKNTMLRIECPEVKEPVAVRYCFQDFCIGSIHGIGDLPLVPFRTDNW